MTKGRESQLIFGVVELKKSYIVYILRQKAKQGGRRRYICMS